MQGIRRNKFVVHYMWVCDMTKKKRQSSPVRCSDVISNKPEPESLNELIHNIARVLWLSRHQFMRQLPFVSPWNTLFLPQFFCQGCGCQVETTFQSKPVKYSNCLCITFHWVNAPVNLAQAGEIKTLHLVMLLHSLLQ